MEALRNTINTADALGYCKACPNLLKVSHCRYGDVEGAKTETIEAPACMLPFLSDQRQPEVAADKNSKESLADGAHPPNNGAQVSAIEKDIVHQSAPNGAKSGVLSLTKPLKLTPTEKEYLRLIADGITAPKAIRECRKSKLRVVYKYLTKLKKKGLIDSQNRMVQNLEGTCAPFAPPAGFRLAQKEQPIEESPRQQHAEGGAVLKDGMKSHQIRVHAQQWRLGILWKDERYKKKVGNTIYDDGNVIYCGREAVEIYGTKSTIADDVDTGTKQSIVDYWTSFFHRVQNDLKIILVKARAQNIKLVKQQYAEVGNELATNCEMTGEKIRIEATEDGKIWLVTDNSFKQRELETQHPQTAQEDMRDIIVPFFNDLRNNKPAKLSEILEVIKELAKENKETACGLNSFMRLFLENQLPKNAEASKEKSKSCMEALGGYA